MEGGKGLGAQNLQFLRQEPPLQFANNRILVLGIPVQKCAVAMGVAVGS